MFDVFDFFGRLSSVALHLFLLNFWIPVPYLVEDDYQYILIFSKFGGFEKEKKNIEIV